MRADLASTFLLLALLAGPLTLARAEPPSSKPGSAPGSTAPRRVGDGMVIPDLDEPDSERSAATKKSSAAATSAPGTPPPPATTTPAPPPVVQAIEPPPILQHDPVAWTRPDVPSGRPCPVAPPTSGCKIELTVAPLVAPAGRPCSST
jgi:hypothetical protein